MDPSAFAADVFLLVSHLAIVPALVYAMRLGAYAEAAILLRMALVSVVYHTCQVGAVCVLPAGLPALRMLDHFVVYDTLVWFVLYFLGLPLLWRVVVTLLLQAIVLPTLLLWMDRWWYVGIPLAAIAVVVLAWLAMRWRALPHRRLSDVLAALALFAVGAALFAIGGEPDPDDPLYGWTHAAWHALVLSVPYFVLDSYEGRGRVTRALGLARWCAGRSRDRALWQAATSPAGDGR